MTAVELRQPEERACERCERREEWAEESWRVVATGEPYCVHEWDINGSFVPLRAAAPDSGPDADDGEST